MLLTIPREKILKIDIINVRGGITASEVYKKYKPDYMINLALYDMATGENITKMKVNGEESGYLFTDEGIGIDNGNAIKWCSFSEENVKNFVAGSPILVKNSTKCIDFGNKYSEYIDGVHIRSVIGFNAKDIFLYTSDKKMSLTELSSFLEGKCDYAINCDGGGSSHLQFRDEIYRKSTRKNASWFLIYLMPEIHYVDYGPIGEVKPVRICLDAGHGKETAGKRSPDGTLLEYEFNRDVTNRLKSILEKHGIEVLLTCDDEHDIDLTTRCMYANDNKCDYFVSIHANAHLEAWTDANGWEIYVVGTGGKAEKLAKCIQKHSIADLGLRDRGIKVANFTVLKDTDMPAVLIEHGFYTNKEECEKLKTDSFRQKCAEADAKGILEHLGIPYEKEVADTDVGELVLTIDKKEYTINGEKKECDIAPRIENGRTLVPIYLLRELGLNVEWNGETKEVRVWK